MSRPGLREQKKQETRARILEAAWVLFSERGFDGVRVSEIARAAQVSEATVFNYFATKEDLVYQGMEEFERTLVSAVAGRGGGTSVLDAFAEFATTPRGALADGSPEATARLADAARIIAESPALLTRELQIVDSATRALASALEGSVAQPGVVAHALMGVHRQMVHTSQRLARAGLTAAEIRELVLAQARAGFTLLGSGLDGLGA